jgi:hypothetical protein
MGREWRVSSINYTERLRAFLNMNGFFGSTTNWHQLRLHSLIIELRILKT